MSIFCGDDVEAVVGDLGSGYSKFGLAGEDTPKVVIPSAVGKKQKKTEENASPSVLGDLHCSKELDIVHPIEAGLVKDWDAVEELWKYAFNELHIDPKFHPVITSTQACYANTAATATAAKDAEKYMELMFEKFDIPCFYMARDAVLDSFAFGRSTALIADIGAGSSRVVPVFDGYTLQHPAQYSSIGCNRLSEYLEQLITERQPPVNVLPRCCFTKKVNPEGRLEVTALSNELISPPTMPASYLKFMKFEVYRDMIETVAFMPSRLLSPEEEQNLNGDPIARYELPDGKVIALDRERYRVNEVLLNPTLYKNSSVKNESASNSSTKGLHRMLYDAVQLCDADLRREMLGNIILCGGGSLLHGLTERLHAELSAMVPSTFKVRFTNVMKIERQFSCFIGGSILASLGSFQQLWVSKKEYDEDGAARLCADRFF
jgi:actin-like protein 6A